MCKEIRQAGEKTCGHTCIAMISGKAESDIVELIGHSKGTKTKEIISALNELGVSNSGKLIRISKKNRLPEIGIVKTLPYDKAKSSGNWHWILKYKSHFLDPLGFENIAHLRFVSFIGIYSHV